jgi:hypothetical protein
MTPAKKLMFAGKPLVNLLGAEGNFETDSNSDGLGDGWTKGGSATAVFTMANNEQTIAVTGEAGSSIIERPAVFTKDNVFYACCEVDSTIQYALIRFRNVNKGLNVQQEIGVSLKGFISIYYKSVIDDDETSNFAVGFLGSSTPYTMKYKKVFLFNLTDSHGAGNEPTQTALDNFMKIQGYFVQRNF